MDVCCHFSNSESLRQIGRTKGTILDRLARVCTVRRGTAKLSRSQHVRGSAVSKGWTFEAEPVRKFYQLQVKKPTRLRHLATNDSSTSGSGSPRVHFIGIGGAGLSALALLALTQGWRVSGSDAVDGALLPRLRAAGVSVFVGHAVRHLRGGHAEGALPEAVVVSSAVAEDNAELAAARSLGVPVYKRAAWLGQVTRGVELLAVAGTHGKSTTSAMLALALQRAGAPVTALVGAEVPQFPDGGGVLVGAQGPGAPFVLEADEYDRCFLGLAPALAVVTCVEWEHVDMFPTEADVRGAFRDFVGCIRPGGALLCCADDAGARHLASAACAPLTVATYGLAEGSDWRAVMLAPNPQGGSDYVVVFRGVPLGRISLLLPGTHNILNSLAVVAAAVTSRTAGTVSLAAPLSPGDVGALKAVVADVGAALAEFRGVRRRFEVVGRARGCLVVDDYAHHPTEVRAVLQAARQRYDRQALWVVFQPHTFSRLAALMADFAPAFSAADRVIVTEVYSAREQPLPSASAEDLVAAITGPPAIFIAKKEDVVERLAWEVMALEGYNDDAVQPRDIVVLTLGAGDITNVGYELLHRLLHRSTSDGEVKDIS